ncbi:flagellar hook-length control protein FliK [Variovorax sp. YR216]|uniref:flagellar hook-length control protein FliK n=1 Tax=Variovorax sp. YR216 TaxID=1882828 RepID=UPI0008989B78|nr:flagellar hook-length control protein FliK [Variovorax sp. YR216]SEA42503.1 hook-length control protein FliK [Variovorax sp. YR216]
MIALSGLIDTLLTAKTSPRMDVLAIKSEAEIGPPGPAMQVGKVANDVRLPSNAALERLAPGALGDASHREGSPTRAAKAELSAAARVISALLADEHGDAGPVRGAAPAWASAKTPDAGALAGTLSQNVSNSGLFYESHLAEFAAGGRTLAQMAQEPQARWSGPGLAVALAAEAQPAGAQPVAAGASLPSPQAEAPQQVVAQGIAPAVDELAASTGKPAAAPAGQGSTAGVQEPKAAMAQPASGDAPLAVDGESHPEAARVQAAYRWAEPPALMPEARPERAAAETVTVRHAGNTVTNSLAPVANEMIHPQSIALVHQQLDLLATSVFRWSGEAWPGVPMQWSIEQETDEREAHAGGEEAVRPWSTTVSMHLPRLGVVDVRLSLVGAGVHARLNAADATTVARLQADGGALARRFDAIGLRLQDFQVSGMNPS